MEYYVIGADGKEYGPANIETLKQWVQDSRVLPGTMLKNFTTGQVVPASSVSELFPAGGPPPVAGQWSQPPSPYLRTPQAGYSMAPVSNAGGGDVAWAIARSALAIIFFFFLRGIGLIFAIYAVVYAVRGLQKGHKLGVLAVVISVVTLVIIAIGWLLRLSAGGGRV